MRGSPERIGTTVTNSPSILIGLGAASHNNDERANNAQYFGISRSQDGFSPSEDGEPNEEEAQANLKKLYDDLDDTIVDLDKKLNRVLAK